VRFFRFESELKLGAVIWVVHCIDVAAKQNWDIFG
jgi:hypothetical protein